MELTELLWIAHLAACMAVITGALTSLIELVKALRGQPHSEYKHQAGRNLMIIGMICYAFLFVTENICKHIGII